MANTRHYTHYWTAPTSITHPKEKKAMDTEKITQRMYELLQEKGHDRVVSITVGMLGEAILINPNVPIDGLLKSWGHNRAPGCVVCDTVQMLVADDDDVRIVDGVTIRGRPS
jgi:hypothetical protein